MMGRPATHKVLTQCSYDKGGYFVVQGQEKVMLMQEKLAKNHIIITHDDKLHGVAEHVTSATAMVNSRASVFVKRGHQLVKHNSLSQPIELPVLFRAMGVGSDQEFLQMISSTSRPSWRCRCSRAGGSRRRQSVRGAHGAHGQGVHRRLLHAQRDGLAQRGSRQGSQGRNGAQAAGDAA